MHSLQIANFGFHRRALRLQRHHARIVFAELEREQFLVAGEPGVRDCLDGEDRPDRRVTAPDQVAGDEPGRELHRGPAT